MAPHWPVTARACLTSFAAISDRAGPLMHRSIFLRRGRRWLCDNPVVVGVESGRPVT